ncbi:S8 family serine peptidase [Streptomyces yanii]
MGVVLAAVAALPGLAGAAGASEQNTGLVSPAASADRASATRVTLVTGDTVEVVKDAGGRQSVHLGAEGASKNTGFQTMSGPNGDLYVLPDDAMDAIASNAVDRELFNVTRLIRDGYADSRSDSLPVIVDYADKPSDATLRTRVDSLPAAARGALLESVDMAGMKVAKKHAGQFWRSVKPVSKPPRHGKTVTAPNASKVSRLWYDGKVQASLDKSVPQIGAPEAWAKGVDGKGVKVAVLDTGVDLNHADVKDRVTATQSFVPGATVQDGNGHGTHVASTIAGSGANSGGKYKGVAPGADLLVGKVLNDSGSGQYSWIMNGMEWAAAQGAKVVSISIGGSTSSPTDSMTQVVDRLSATTRTLFVIAAGNNGPGATTITSPGTADSALTVGAVDKSDALAGFSSRGPRVGDSAIKPEITAPGVNIVAARAAGTSLGTPVDANYTSVSGTSMATPHVAGAAVLLAQRHPDWTGQRIKAALTTHAKLNSAYSVYQQGNGRVDVPAALDPALELSGTADFGLIAWHPGTYDKVTRTVTVTNSTDSATTVTPAIGGNFPEGAVTVPGPVEVAAGASAEITVTLDPNLAPGGPTGGTLTLTSSSGATTHTAIGLDKQREPHKLTVHFKDRKGQPSTHFVYNLVGISAKSYRNGFGYTGTLELTLPAERYSLMGTMDTQKSVDEDAYYARDFFAFPAIDLTSHDAELTVDGTKATDFKLDVRDETRPLETSDYTYEARRFGEDKRSLQSYSMSNVVMSEQHAGAVPVEAPQKGDGELWTAFYQTRREPLIQASVTRPDSYALTPLTPYDLNRFDSRNRYDIVDVGAGTAKDLAGLDLKGKAALLHLNYYFDNEYLIQRVEAAGAAAIILAPNGDQTLTLYRTAVKVANFSVPYDEGRRLTADVAAGRTTIDVRSVKQSRYQYTGQYDWNTGIPANLSTPSMKDDYAKVRRSFHSDGTGRQGKYLVNTWGSNPVGLTGRWWLPLQQGTERDEYMLALPGTSYQAVVDSSWPGFYPVRMVETPRSYLPGTSVTEHWFAPVQHPSVAPSSPCSFCRSDLGTTFAPGLGGDSDPTHSARFGVNRTWAYYRNGEQIDGPNPKIFVPEKADYTFVTTDTSTDNALKLGGKVVTEYGFTSAAPTSMEAPDCTSVIPAATACEALPVIQLHYRMKTSLLNEVAAGKPFTTTVDASRAPGFTGDSRMAGAKFSVSYDDGATWKSVDADRTDNNSFKAHFTNAKLSRSNGYVSIKAEVWDKAGNRTVQIVTRAYALK